MDNLILRIIEISTDIFKSVGPGYSEAVYHNAFEVGLRMNNINYQTEVITPIYYKGYNIGHGRIDILVVDEHNNSIVIELKALSNFSNQTANIQINNYMKHVNSIHGIIINFGQPYKNGIPELNIKYLLHENNNSRNFIFNNDSQLFVEQSVLLNGTMSIS